jgi:hypothetical protein
MMQLPYIKFNKFFIYTKASKQAGHLKAPPPLGEDLKWTPVLKALCKSKNQAWLSGRA